MAKECLEHCISTLRYEPCDQPEGQLRDRAQEEHFMLSEHIRGMMMETAAASKDEGQTK